MLISFPFYHDFPALFRFHGFYVLPGGTDLYGNLGSFCLITAGFFGSYGHSSDSSPPVNFYML